MVSEPAIQLLFYVLGLALQRLCCIPSDYLYLWLVQAYVVCPLGSSYPYHGYVDWLLYLVMDLVHQQYKMTSWNVRG
jgi:hypothetical protein